MKKALKWGAGLTLAVISGIAGYRGINNYVESRLYNIPTPNVQIIAPSESMITQGYTADTVRVYQEITPTITPTIEVMQESPTPVPSKFDEISAQYGPIINAVPSIDLNKYVEDIEAANIAANPSLENLIDHDINDGRLNILMDFNRNMDNRYSSDIMIMLSMKYDEQEKRWEYNLININRDLYSPEIGGRINQNEWTKGYSQRDFYDTITRMTGLMPHLQLHVGDSHLFVDLIDKILGGTDVCFSDTVKDPNLGIFFEEGKCYHVDGYATVYAAVSRYTDTVEDRMTRQMDIFEGMVPDMIDAYTADPLKLVDTLNLLNQYQEEGKFWVRKTSDAYAIPKDQNWRGYASEYTYDPAYNLSYPDLLSLTIAAGKGFLENRPLNEGMVNVASIPEVLNNNCMNPDGSSTMLKCPTPGFYPNAKKVRLVFSDEELFRYYAPIRTAARDTMLDGQ